MSDSWELRVYDQKQLVSTAELTGPAVLGRQQSETETLFAHSQADGRQRVAIAPRDDRTVSRNHLLVEPLPNGFRLTNWSDRQDVGLPDNQVLQPQASQVVAGGVLLSLGRKTVRLRHVSPADESPQALAEPTTPPGTRAPSAGVSSFLSGAREALRSHRFRCRTQFDDAREGIDPREALRWLEEALDLLQGAASPGEFFPSAAEAVIRIGNFDSGRVLLWQQDDWRTQAFALSPALADHSAGSFSRSILNRVRQEKRTFWQGTGTVLPDSDSVRQIEAVVAAPSWIATERSSAPCMARGGRKAAPKDNR